MPSTADTALERDLANVQADTEAIPRLAKTVEFKGKRFRIADKVGLMPLMRFAHAAANQDAAAAGDMDALAAIYDMLKDCIYPGNGLAPDEEGYDGGDWKAFERHATETKADHDELLPVVTQVIEMMTARPTVPSSPSSAGPQAISGASTGNSSAAPAGDSNGSPRAR